MVLPQFLLNTVLTAAVNLLLGIGCYYSYGATRFLNLGQAGYITVAAYTFFLVNIVLGQNLFVAGLAGLATAALIAVCLEGFVFAPLGRKGANEELLLLASLAVYILLHNGVAVAFGDGSKILLSGKVEAGLLVFGARVTTVQLLMVAVAVCAAVASWSCGRFTWYGRAIRAVGDNPNLCTVFGIDCACVRLYAVGLGGAVAGIAGMLVGLDTDLVPTMGFRLLVGGMVVMIAGGRGSIVGMCLAAFLLGIAQNVTAYLVDIKWTDPVTYLALIACLLFRPKGMAGRLMRGNEV